ncbi:MULTISPECIES: 3-deoxy-7-phosphoheptulonate synthase [unclassified Rhodococcus (in: high G+C Gram-positive bacteria)]|uniref:3-deoxy-7-phosphoheptulonate synthase n=1 Tax=unclassified Rhodococcus (in: high G+C Gram-positive bacteria) TaxID=192944 RepID=UPI0007BB8A79|nr:MULTISPECIES: 3-deoxy-7-phosphoheptulonate synthase [unclassified Rhodococcus (in: high G+C Gram-positive bacteria)]KZF04678.1 phospho-2-dehydro-3-deoxyheptonate aldolase [Rhodococcus sp. EPR-279]KZF08587.1 phospho-2-dehydro-3-deoxyheptonate aldolase [Rhodococcus sp. EPR-147]OZE37737.1 3-deoxy-7-phosphoheptulonate synthase [Rhodococcus sp. 05-2254-4]OZE44872.1 3-deoxy-7-phosphoheptulonate synthase [Rhodococcus sp. 05-2254-3]OZE45860.1 3-deoxy-7-phosphoheptulonate synthase [Rhodococcus sp. 0
MTLSLDTPPLDDQRTISISPLVAPSVLRRDHAVDDAISATVRSGRAGVVDVLDGRDDRLIVVVGPCSVHDTDAALDYARRLAAKASELGDRLHIVMRVYFEKPRTTLGWKGLINDPHLDGSFDINAGLRVGRQLLLDISALGLPVGCEFLDPITPQYIADLVSYGAIGARTAASQVHRQLCSALSMPVGIKNSTEGDIQVAVDGTRAAAASHVFPGTDLDGQAALIRTVGNPDCHVILRGGVDGPNYDAESVADTVARLRKSGLPERVVIDASHGNSRKDHNKQVDVVTDVAARVAAGEHGIVGLMLESFLVAGRQDLELGHRDDLLYGQSITDACLDWATTATQLDTLAAAVEKRRASR